MDASYLWPNLKLGLSLILDVLTVLAVLTGIQVYLSVRRNRLLRSIDRSLKMLPGVNRELKRVA